MMGQLLSLPLRSLPPLEGAEAMAERLAQLSTFLVAHEHLWRVRPFLEPHPAWTQRYPEVYDWLVDLDPDQVDALERDPAGLRAGPAPLAQLLDHARPLIEVGRLPGAPLSQLLDPVPRVHGRKEGQVRALGGVAIHALPDEARMLVDWCCGKGHLGRTLALESALPLLGLEKDARLCGRGRDLAAGTDALCTFLPTDVRDPLRLPALAPLTTAIVALHACGDLGDAAIQAAMEQHALSLVLAPCCPRVGSTTGWTARSAAGRASGLVFDEPALRLATLEEVSAARAVCLRRRKLLGWRQAFHYLVQQAGGPQTYTAPGPLPPRWQHLDFAVFAESLSASSGMSIPPSFDAEVTLAEGHRRAHHSRSLGLVRGIFRRPLEVWLVLDRALRLAEADWPVRIGTFCEPELSPRNLAIVAWHPSVDSR